MLKAARQDALLRFLHTRDYASTGDVTEYLQVSPATARRDLAEMESRALVERIWGGVRLPAEVDDPFHEALARSSASKARIGAAAAALVPDGATVILDIGTTVHAVARELASREVTVLTASLPGFEVLREGGQAGIVILGGQWSEQYQCFAGTGVLDALAHRQADFAFLGCSGVSDTGRVRDTSDSQSVIKRAIRASSTTAYLLADAGKFPGKGASSPFGVDQLDGIITDARALPNRLLELCQAHDTEVLRP